MINNLELYRVFYWTAKELNLSRAAERLFITQPSVSHAIKQLETELGVALFHRGSKGVKLTEEGSLLMLQVDKAFRSIESAERHIAEMHQLMRGELRLGSSDSLCKHYLLPHLGRFCSEHPRLRIDVAHGTTPEIIRLIKEDRIDFGIVRMPVEDPALVVMETIEVQDRFVAGPRFFHLTDNVLKLSELVSHPLILFTKTSSSRKFVEDMARSHGVLLEPEIELASVDLLVEFAKAGLGISFVTRQFVQSELDTGKLKEIRLAEPIPARKIGIAFLKNRLLSSATKVFIREYLGVPGLK
ncbi:LysR family transcriptional regulator [Paenibacillus allorhizosphaerae]|uniref:HTH-type transcriptional regulator GltR n=1 Tax=Paenibacillus allorhizosphaerae TaxID=2849866 RepID=A0ABN7TGP8_9BACL|nr:LysR family transcriptional regulator [Paenibacillus allorhizosphaerae]CAG7625111.1 HTH-type transcriptional regulator GltR [Paenibacillus allorhizosphaerae]